MNGSVTPPENPESIPDSQEKPGAQNAKQLPDRPPRKKPSFIRRILTHFLSVIAEITEPLYWAVLGVFRQRWIVSPFIFFKKHYIMIVTVVVGVFLARGIFIFPMRHYLVYTTLPVFLLLAFAKPILALNLYLVFSLGMLAEAIWNFPKIRLGSPLLLLAIFGWWIKRFRNKADKVLFIQDSNNVFVLLLWSWITLLHIFKVSIIYETGIVSTWLLLFFVCTHLVADDERKLFYIISTVTAIFAYYAINVLKMAAYYGLATNYTVTADIPGRLSDNNELAACLNMSLPLFYALFLLTPKKWLKFIWLSFFVLDIVAIIYTRSRGGYLAMSIVFILILFKLILTTQKKTVPILFITVFIISGYGFFYQRVHERIEDTMNWRNDPSARNRLLSVITGWNMVKDHPLTGVGLGRGYMEFMNYCPPITTISVGFGDDLVLVRPSKRLVLHNAYAQIIGEGGFISFFLFLCLMIGSIIKMRRLRRLTPKTPENTWIITLTHALEISIISYMITGMFLSNAFEQYIYIVLACVSSLWYITEGKSEQKITASSKLTVVWIFFLFGYWLYITIGFRLLHM